MESVERLSFNLTITELYPSKFHFWFQHVPAPSIPKFSRLRLDVVVEFVRFFLRDIWCTRSNYEHRHFVSVVGFPRDLLSLI